MTLSPRLEAIYRHLLPAQNVWDFCCDHGYLGIKALSSSRFPQVNFVDQAPHLIETLRDQWSHSPGARFEACRGEDIDRVVEGSVVIAGVGAHCICKILHALLGSGRLQAQRLILAPHRHEDQFLQLLEDLGLTKLYHLSQQEIVVERERSRFIFVWDKASAR